MIYVIHSFVFAIVLLFQSIFPVINFQSFKITPDFLLIILTFYSLRNNRFYCVIIGFLIGSLQDFLSQIDLIGAFAFIKSFAGFILGSLNEYLSFLSRKLIFGFIFLIYVIHFSIFYFFRFNNVIIDLFLLSKIILINSVINFLIFILVDKILFNSLLIKE